MDNKSVMLAKFNEDFIKTNKVAKEKRKLYNELFDLRQDGDYADFVIMTKETTGPLINETKELIDLIKSHIK